LANFIKLSVFLIALGRFGVAQADDDAVARFKDYFPEQIKAMTKEQLDKVPIMYTGAANLATAEGGDLIIQANLNSLMYNGIADFEGAKRAFQADLGEAPTGKLTVGQIHTLGYRSSRLTMTYVSFFPFSYGGRVHADYAKVTGTVKILDEKIAYPINHVVIECYKSESYCKYRQVALVLPDKNSFSQSYSVTEVANEYYKVNRWENSQIDASPYEATGCRINQLSFNFVSNEFFEIARNNDAEDCKVLGIEMPRLEKPRVSQIVNGDEIVSAEFRKINDEAFSYYSSEFRNRLTSIKGKRVEAKDGN